MANVNKIIDNVFETDSQYYWEDNTKIDTISNASFIEKWDVNFLKQSNLNFSRIKIDQFIQDMKFEISMLDMPHFYRQFYYHFIDQRSN